MLVNAPPTLTGNNRPYQITTVGKTVGQEAEITVHGPGIEPSGQRFTFASLKRAEMFVSALNSAYAQGIAEGFKMADVRRKTQS
jgi:hypothetical protein